jgi:quercetin dioxygenase-like cupin family protein
VRTVKEIEQITCIAEGKVNFIVSKVDRQTVNLDEAGDLIVVPPDAPHMVEVLGEMARLIDGFYPMREDFL